MAGRRASMSTRNRFAGASGRPPDWLCRASRRRLWWIVVPGGCGCHANGSLGSTATSWNESRASHSHRSCTTRCSGRSAWTAAPSTGRRSGRPTTGRRRPLLERRGPGSLPFLPAERRLDRRSGRARPGVDRGAADGPGTARGRAGRLRARCRPPPLEHVGSAAGPAGTRRRWLRVPVRPVVAAAAGIGVAILTNSDDHQLWNDLALSILADLVTEPGVYRDRLLALLSGSAAGGRSGLVVRAPGRAGERRRRCRHGRDGRSGRPLGGLRRHLPKTRVGYLDPTAPPDRSSWTPASPTSRPTTRRRRGSFATASPRSSPACSFADNGETLDLRGPAPTWRNLSAWRLIGWGMSWGGPHTRVPRDGQCMEAAQRHPARLASNI
jgi:hypothetical protein